MFSLEDEDEDEFNTIPLSTPNATNDSDLEKVNTEKLCDKDIDDIKIEEITEFVLKLWEGQFPPKNTDTSKNTNEKIVYLIKKYYEEKGEIPEKLRACLYHQVSKKNVLYFFLIKPTNHPKKGFTFNV